VTTRLVAIAGTAVTEDRQPKKENMNRELMESS